MRKYAEVIMPDRVYLDWNATAPLRPEARAAMIEAMDVVGNPSSVHTEGRAAKMIVEKAREQVASLVGCDMEEVVFTSGATEAAAFVILQPRYDRVEICETDHDCFFQKNTIPTIKVRDDGLITNETARMAIECVGDSADLYASCVANGETGVLLQPFWVNDLAEKNNADCAGDVVQVLGKAEYNFVSGGETFAITSSHKLGGPKGVGGLIKAVEKDIEPLSRGGGQEKGRRSGTENVIGIAGFGAAAEAAQRDLYAGAWEPIEELRNDLEAALCDCAGDELTIFGENAPRLPNTSCFAIPGWKGETQVMQLDLAGFAVSAGSACSSGKVGPSRVLKAMGFDDNTASSAIRVSMGSTTTKDEVSRFIDAWTALYQKMKTRAA